MELREFADGMRQDQQFNFLVDRLNELDNMRLAKAAEYDQEENRETKNKIYKEIKRIESLHEVTEGFVHSFLYNEMIYGVRVSDSVLDLYQVAVEHPFAEYEKKIGDLSASHNWQLEGF
jgi:hypothetical protein